MSFARQVWWSRTVALALIVLAAVLTGLGQLGGQAWLSQLEGPVTTAGFVGLSLGVMGGVLRPLQRWMWWNVVAPAAIYTPTQKRRVARGSVKWWLHLDGDLCDRDGLKGVKE